MRCASCGFENPEGAKFCIECGGAVKHACPSCGFDNLPQAKFCAECGTLLVRQSHVPSRTFQVEEKEADSRLQTLGPRPVGYIPKHLAERIRAEQAAMEARGAVE